MVPYLTQRRSEQSSQDENWQRRAAPIARYKSQCAGDAYRPQRVFFHNVTGLELRSNLFNLLVDLSHGLMKALPRFFQFVPDSVDVVFHFDPIDPIEPRSH
jgi:hypothetical protein